MNEPPQISPYPTPYDDAYATCERTVAALRIYTGELDPNAVTRATGVEPTQLNIRGTKITNSRGRTRTVPKNAWFLSSEEQVESQDLRRHLDWLLDRIETGRAGLLELQRDPEVTMHIHLIWWSRHGEGGPTLWPTHLHRIASLNLEVQFEIAFYGED